MWQLGVNERAICPYATGHYATDEVGVDVAVAATVAVAVAVAHLPQCTNQMQSKLDLSRLKCFRKSISVPLSCKMCI